MGPAALCFSVYNSQCGATLPRNKGFSRAETHLYLSHFACRNHPLSRSCTDVTSIFSRGLDVNQLYRPNGSLPPILDAAKPSLPGFDCLPTVTVSGVTSLHPSTLPRCHPAVGGKEENESWELSAGARGGFFPFPLRFLKSGLLLCACQLPLENPGGYQEGLKWLKIGMSHFFLVSCCFQCIASSRRLKSI